MRNWERLIKETHNMPNMIDLTNQRTKQLGEKIPFFLKDNQVNPYSKRTKLKETSSTKTEWSTTKDNTTE